MESTLVRLVKLENPVKRTRPSIRGTDICVVKAYRKLRNLCNPNIPYYPGSLQTTVRCVWLLAYSTTRKKILHCWEIRKRMQKSKRSAA